MRSLTAGLEILSQTEPGNIFGMLLIKININVEKHLLIIYIFSNAIMTFRCHLVAI